MKKFEEMKKDNKGFSLVELIVVIAIMVVLVAVLGSTILGYVEKSKYSKDIQALDSIKTACSTFAVDPEANYTSGTPYTLAALMSDTADATTGKVHDPYNIIENTLKETFVANNDKSDWTFQGSSEAFKGLKASDVKITIKDGAVSIYIPVTAASSSSYAPYKAGTEYATETATRK